jgi:outer membrane biosynthesis protein TonB
MKKLFMAIVSVCLIAETSLATTRAAGHVTRGTSQPAPQFSARGEKRGYSLVRVTTDSFGNVTKAVVVERHGSIPDRDVISYAETLKGPSISVRIMRVDYWVYPSGKATLSQPGWRLIRPTYPRAAMAARAQGKGVVRVSTNGSGDVDKVVIIKKIHPLLDAHTAAFARAYWKGPPNARVAVPVIYQLK